MRIPAMRMRRIVFGVADAVCGGVALLLRPLSANDLIAQAQRATALSVFGNVRFSKPLRHFLHRCIAESDLSLVGQIATRRDVVRLLSNLLRMHQGESENPAIAAQPIVAPIFVTSLPRSGTRFLQPLLMQDGANMLPRAWQTIYPYPERPYGIRTFHCAAAMTKPAAMAANRAHPARIVLGPGGLESQFYPPRRPMIQASQASECRGCGFC